MTMHFFRVLFVCLAGVWYAAPAVAQTPPAPVLPVPLLPAPAPTGPNVAPPPSSGYKSRQWVLEQVSFNHLRFTGQVEIEFGTATRFFADHIDYYTDTGRLAASGNVVFANGDGRISADRIEFNTHSQTGTFFEASGIMSLGAQADPTQFGGQDPDVYFYGETIEKLGPKKYKLTRGGFTTCVQPTPRWELTSGSVTLNLQDYAVLRSTVLRVKGVPLFYLPYAYYPIKDEERATGFLLPTYGTSTVRGQAISNAFFWAINRSHDATLFHDWFTRTGQGYGTEYRYVSGPQSEGLFRVYRFSQKQTTFENNGTTVPLPESRSFEVSANATQTLARGLRARSRVDYFSDIVTKQLYHQNLYQATNRNRVVSAGLTGNWGPYATTFAYDRTESFSDEDSFFVYGSTPRLTGSIAPQRLFGAPIYASLNSEWAILPYRSEDSGVTTADRGLTRFDMSPLVRVPVSRWTFLTLNTSAQYRLTRYSESNNQLGIQVPEPFTRSFFDLRADAVGPVFTKIWDAAAASRAERYKHVIEPTFGFNQITPIDAYQRVPILSNTSDRVVGGVTRFTYGLNNRFLRRDRPLEGVAGQARELFSVAVQQTYYSNAEASQFDPSYSSSQSGKQVDLSPVALIARYSPTLATNVSGRAEYDVSGGGLQSVSLSGTVAVGGQSGNASLSRRRFSTGSPAETVLNGGGSFGTINRRLTANYAFSWDISRSTLLSQSIVGTYQAQCCGFSAEFQNYNYGQVTSIPFSADRRINFSFTLAGLGTFSNFFGAFGGQR